QLGQTLRFGKAEWKVVGIFDAGGTAYSSEVWCDVNELKGEYNRESYSSVYLRVTDSGLVESLSHRAREDQRLALDANAETTYYAEQTRVGEAVRAYGLFIAFIMAIGSCFAAMNAMYAAVASRFREIGTLRVLGFSRGSILLSFSIESVILALSGGIIG